MKKILILLLAAVILFSGCTKTTMKTGPVKDGDNVSIDYTGSLLDGTVFDTSIEKVAKENNVYTPGREYKPLNFTVGKGDVIKGLDEGVVGMKVGVSKTLTILPEKGYGPVIPFLIQILPIIENVSTTREIPKVLDVSPEQFDSTVGTGHHVGESVLIPGTNINFTILSINSTNVTVSYNLKVGDNIWVSRAPWNETVVKIDDKNITLKPNVSMNQIIQLMGEPWNTTVIGLSNVNITLRHNAIPDTTITTRSMFGQIVPMRIRFNETSIIMDQNQKYAGKTLIFNVTLVSIQ